MLIILADPKSSQDHLNGGIRNLFTVPVLDRGPTSRHQTRGLPGKCEARGGSLKAVSPLVPLSTQLALVFVFFFSFFLKCIPPKEVLYRSSLAVKKKRKYSV